MPLTPATSFPIFIENPDPLATLPLVIVTFPEASKTVPSAYAVKEAIISTPALTEAPNFKLPDMDA